MYSIVFLIPLFITIGSVLFLGERVRWKRFTAIIAGFLGAIISIDPFTAEVNEYVFIALLAPVLAAASYLIVRKYGHQETLYSFLIYGKLLMILFLPNFCNIFIQSNVFLRLNVKCYFWSV